MAAVHIQAEDLIETLQDVSVIVLPTNIYYATSKKDILELTFQVQNGDTVYHFNLRTRHDKILEDDSCFMEGFVYAKELQTVEMTVCNGIIGTFNRNSTKASMIMPLFNENEEVTIDRLSVTPHVITTINAEDELPVYSTFISNEIVKGGRTRSARGIEMATIVPINRAEGVVYMYYMNPSTHKRQYFSRLRNNEKNFIRTVVGTTWLAYDENQNPLLLNNNYNLLILPKHLQDNFDVLITSTKQKKTKSTYRRMTPRFVKIHVTADDSFMKKHADKESAEKYINSLIKGTNLVFRDKSLDASFHVILEGINYVKNREVKIQSKDPKKSLKDACRIMYDKKKELGLDFHFGLFLTRRNFGYSGFTPLYRMCVNYKSCALVFDSGIRTSFIIAHEIGHSVGIAHDGDHNECGVDVAHGSVMAPQVHSRFDRFFWSNCSRRQIHQNIRYFSCLLKEKPPKINTSALDLPGVTHNLDGQCKYTFGRKYSGCLGIRSPDQYCRFLFCRVPNQKNRCSYLSLPPVDGTICAKNQWCVKGKCIPFGRLTPTPVDGGFSKWSAWSSCTTRCGPGVSKRYRKCDSPRPIFGGKPCNGSKTEWKMCQDYTPCHIHKTFEDQRDDSCYAFGTGWKWFRPSDISRRLRNLSFDLNFENGFGSWTHAPNTTTKWQLHQGATQTPETGPSVDHTFGNKTGKYMYFESSYPRLKGDNAMLVSPTILTPATCVRLYFHMLGKRIGTLKILQLDVNNTIISVLWKRSSSAGKYWYKIQFDVFYHKEYKIGIEATRGSSYLSDFAIDDIEITPGQCLDRRAEPTLDDTSPCRLYCRHPQKNYLQIGKDVSDGLKCSSTSSNICVDGKCQRLGCDGLIGSDKQYDKCGICGGKDIDYNCAQQEFNIKVQLTKLSQPILKVPEIASEFVITKTTPSDVKLAMKDNVKRATYYYGHYPRTGYDWYYFTINKATLRYEIPYNRTERVYIDKANGMDAEVQLISPGPRLNKTSINLTYKFYIPIGLNLTNDVYSWIMKGWTECSAPCNGGTKEAQYHCLNLRTNEEVASGNCSSESVKLLPKLMACNIHKCVTKYEYGYTRWGRCDRCGQIGSKSRTVFCLKKKEGEKSIKVNDTLCSKVAKPSTQMKCFRYCPKIRKCIEKSRMCPRLFKQGYCSYRTVQTLCCKTCIPQTSNELGSRKSKSRSKSRSRN
ncbi:A disintegrin and metalloproteinase with thrombospondin motifs 2-like isoform X1 [Clytia hemisphaerica]|uniref:Uncharacterized protein n=1 Tax=Clytia hemisphaerica TaxID=252671 RepID=A0A7M5X865_9CNID